MESSERCCLICREVLTSEKDFVEHSCKEHSSKTTSKFHCSACNKDFRDSFNLRRHMSFLHRPKSEPKNQKDTRCLLCSKQFVKKDILSHFLSEHNIEVEEENLTFPSVESFEVWKSDMEAKTKSRYVKVRNVYKYKDGSTLNSFYCHRDGYAKDSKSKQLRKMKSSGSNKINGHCPSKVVVKCSREGTVMVRFIKTHVGHAAELKRIALSRKDKEVLAEKLSLNVPFDQILDDIRDSMRDTDLQRLHLLSKQDLRNIARDFNLKRKDVNQLENTEVSQSHEPSMEKLLQVQSSFVRLYKPKGSVSNDFPQLRSKDFLLLLMNDTQKEILEKFGNLYVCIDVTRGLQLHDIDMYTLYIIDDMQQIFPCALAFSNRRDVVAIELILFGIQGIIKRNIQPEILVTNDVLHDAWCAVMSAPLCHIYCPWLVDIEWRKNLRRIKDKEKQTVVYRGLRKLLEEKNVSIFDRGLDEMCSLLENDHDTYDFLQYFEKYKYSCDKWAQCHRLYLGSLLGLEGFHKSLKYIFLKKQKSSNLNYSIYSIMSFLRGKYFNLPLSMMTDKSSVVRIGHKLAINMTQANLSKIDNLSWDVSDSNDDEVFRVEKYQACRNDCLSLCRPCEACIHLYSCTCYESAINWSMCQHIHLVCIIAKHEKNLSAETRLEGSGSEREGVGPGSPQLVLTTGDSDSETVMYQETTPLSLDMELRKKHLLDRFTSLLNTATSLEQLDSIASHLDSCDQFLNGTHQSLQHLS